MTPKLHPSIAALLLLALTTTATLAQSPAPAGIRPFRIQTEDSVLEDLRERLAKTRWPDQVPDSAWDYGVDQAYMKALVAHWRTDYDWRKHERELNALPHFTTELDGLTLHFIHVRSPHEKALPLLLVHGWPGSVVEFQKIIPMLTEPEKFGGRAEDACHIVAPSLPGFGFSSAPQEPGWNSQRMAEVFAKLMARLGYARYGAQGGDWGGGIVRWLAANDGDHCLGAHSNFPGANRPASEPMRGVTEAEVARMEKRISELADHKAYGAIQGTRPLTLAYALNDSPAGLAAWIVDKFWAWSDHGGSLDQSFTKDELLTNIMLYWVTQSMPSATRIYYESQHNLPRPAAMTPFTSSSRSSPMGFALFPKEINVPPRAWVERTYGDQLIHWTEMPRGGHFAAMEQPALLSQDIHQFFQKVRQP
jgi:pimeloyl-ACP methyl ester carboxylesterase